MGETQFLLPNLMMAYAAYLIATFSPGPANLAVMATSMRAGRRAGLMLASGVVLGSLVWGILAALGLAAFLTAYAGLAEILRLVGGLYLLWLAFKSWRAVLNPSNLSPVSLGTVRSDGRYFSIGLAIHLTNPKSILAWMAIIAIGAAPGSPSWVSFAVVAGCWFMGIVLYLGFALAFSTPRMIAAYGKCRRWVDGITGTMFGVAGVRLLLGER